jgi:ferredoxin--NADP+ reductase
MSDDSPPLRVAVVGAGPAGFYAAERLLKAAEHHVEVELFDRLPTPWGLVRAGVAPDHPKIKAVSKRFEATAALTGFRFHGNVEVGEQITHQELLAHHHAVLYTTGASRDRRLGIPGEDLRGSWPATEFVGWYNGHPDHGEMEYDLQTSRVVVVGNGNVAVDVARMLVLPREEHAVTDIADHALEVLSSGGVQEVVVLGRRGPAQAAYTTPELRELGELTDADVIVDPRDVELDAGSAAWLASDAADETARKNVEVATAYAARTPTGKPKRVILRFLASPVEILGSEHVTGVRIVHNELVTGEDGSQRARATGEEEIIECGMVLRSVGYRGTPVAGVPFDERAATIANVAGRVVDPDGDAPLPGVYTAGWIKRGPSGVIGTNKKCANETVAHLLEDAAAGLLPVPSGDGTTLEALLRERCPQLVDYSGWQLIDAFERAAGEAQGRPRVKLTRLAELLEHAGITSE